MPETANNTIDKVRQLQRQLWVCAKRSKTRRFDALYDRIYRGDVLWEASRRVRSNRAAAGLGAETIEAVEQRGVDRFLAEIQATLRAGRYRPQPVRRRCIPTADGKQRQLEIPTMRDRVVQMAAKLVIEPIFEAGFQPCSYGFRPNRGATDFRLTANWWAMALSDSPYAAASTMLLRMATCCGVPKAERHCRSCCWSASCNDRADVHQGATPGNAVRTGCRVSCRTLH
jgi:hypothetical protein